MRPGDVARWPQSPAYMSTIDMLPWFPVWIVGAYGRELKTMQRQINTFTEVWSEPVADVTMKSFKGYNNWLQRTDGAQGHLVYRIRLGFVVDSKVVFELSDGSHAGPVLLVAHR